MDRCFISEKASIGKNVSFGYFVVIEDGAVIGDNCSIANNVVVHKGTVVGNDVRIDDNAVIGKQPMRAANSIFKGDEKLLEPAKIGEGSLIGAGSIVYAGFSFGDKTLLAVLAAVSENVIVG